MAAPLVVRSAEDRRADLQEVTVLLHDFTFRDPAEVLAALTGGGMGHGGHAMMDHGATNHGTSHAGHAMPPATPMSGGVPMNLNDVEYDAYLANDRTFDDPEVVRVERGGRVRLRLINGATSTAFHIDLGTLDGTVVAIDPLPQRPADRTLRVELTGGMAPYVWSMDGKVWGEASPIRVVRGGRVRIDMVNRSPMAHPMHLHGHHFQVVALNGDDVAGAVRDTVLVPLD